jgi:hypothetical protein
MKNHGTFPEPAVSRTRLVAAKTSGINKASVMDEHIANAKLYEVVVEEAALSPIEIDHLRTCDECMEVVRIMVRNRVSA